MAAPCPAILQGANCLGRLAPEASAVNPKISGSFSDWKRWSFMHPGIALFRSPGECSGAGMSDSIVRSRYQWIKAMRSTHVVHCHPASHLRECRGPLQADSNPCFCGLITGAADEGPTLTFCWAHKQAQGLIVRFVNFYRQKCQREHFTAYEHLARLLVIAVGDHVPHLGVS